MHIGKITKTKHPQKRLQNFLYISMPIQIKLKELRRERVEKNENIPIVLDEKFHSIVVTLLFRRSQ